MTNMASLSQALIHPDNPPSGPYGGTSLVWFPTQDYGSLIGFGSALVVSLLMRDSSPTRLSPSAIHVRRAARPRSGCCPGPAVPWRTPTDAGAPGVAVWIESHACDRWR